ncbi:hypothetical protein EV175_001863 [Coemansia sp. RSA 1933]|nr:hypothetical protein EV175_001863 [Coemansia sp. RSA 1933]
MGLVRMLVFGDDDEPVVYPRLKRLEFSKHTDIGKVNTVRMDESVVPFPELRYLKWVGCYGFEDDTLFRANIDKLEYLNIDFSAELLDMLQKADIFGNGRASEIGCITANIIYNNHNAVNLDSCADHIANLISPKTRVVRTSLLFLHSNVATITSKSPYTGNITVLTLKSIALSLLQMIEIIQSMPQMTDLLCVVNS